MRLVIVLAVAAAVTVMLGLLLMAASVVMRLLTRHQPAHMARLGLDVVAVSGARARCRRPRARARARVTLARSATPSCCATPVRPARGGDLAVPIQLRASAD